ncbi:hypothetical protein [Mesorhizobium sp. B2-5-4]|uniref:hypothetical protein n=1 Tax=Mesorhizobium sp. B2-5-4 TaxID=2589926 RepID=UPI0015E2A0E5|nr:hypothetical protein [Mesorhizobium sp. B2-5-4]
MTASERAHAGQDRQDQKHKEQVGNKAAVRQPLNDIGSREASYLRSGRQIDEFSTHHAQRQALSVFIVPKEIGTAREPATPGASRQPVDLVKDIQSQLWAFMYSPNRPKQIEFVTQHLKEGGIFVFVEKFRAADESDYQRREYQKDYGFKARYFPPDEIAKKKTDVLGTMFNNEVTLAEMARSVGAHFKYCTMTWNSGNFCSLAASNSKENLDLYASQMSAPAIPHEYVYETSVSDVATIAITDNPM